MCSCSLLGCNYGSFRQVNRPTENSKKKIIETKVIIEGSQDGKVGEVDSVAMRALFNILRNKAPKGVSFSAHRLDSYLYGGTCSSMTLNFVKDYFHMQSSEEDTNLLVELSQKYSKSGQKFRSEQVALNSIELDDSYLLIDEKKAKVQAISNAYDLKVTDCSKVFELYKIQDNLNSFRNELDTLENGVHILRILYDSSYNHKKENWGHTLAFFKFEEGCYLYDPNQGLIQIASEDVSDKLVENFIKYEEEWSLHQPRFYKVQSIANEVIGSCNLNNNK